MKIPTDRKEFETCLATLVSAATNRTATTQQRGDADRALKNMAEAFRKQGFSDSAIEVDRAVAVVASRRALAARMGLTATESVHRQGRELIFPAGAK